MPGAAQGLPAGKKPSLLVELGRGETGTRGRGRAGHGMSLDPLDNSPGLGSRPALGAPLTPTSNQPHSDGVTFLGTTLSLPSQQRLLLQVSVPWPRMVLPA
jgi:hypothetical protein